MCHKLQKVCLTENLKAEYEYPFLKEDQQAGKVCTICHYQTKEFISIITTAHHSTVTKRTSQFR
jgi:hypothetical protein